MSFLKLKPTYTQIIAFGFLILILTGTLLLCLPAASRGGTATPFTNCLFTATSATCVTGLTVVDTYAHWSLFGQLVILALIQIGGLGFMTVIAMFFLFLHKKITIGERKLLMQSAGGIQPSGIIAIVKRALLGTLIIEALGAVSLFLRFSRDMPFGKAAYYAVFHSISAFCNAGFDLMSSEGSASFSAYTGDLWINITLMCLIVLGGLGFFVWTNVLACRFRFSKFELHTKIVLCFSAFLLLTGTVLFFLSERNVAFSEMNTGKKWLAAAFQSVTTRTAGFFTVDMSSLSESGSLISVVYMLIGGSPGSTAGGIKTTTVAVIIAAAISCARNHSSTVLFKRKIESKVVRQATAIVFIYLFATIGATALLCAIEDINLTASLFEVSSAIATVGLTQGVTPSLSTVAKLVITLLMYAGRIGGLSFVLALAEKRSPAPIDRPTGKIMIG